MALQYAFPVFSNQIPHFLAIVFPIRDSLSSEDPASDSLAKHVDRKSEFGGVDLPAFKGFWVSCTLFRGLSLDFGAKDEPRDHVKCERVFLEEKVNERKRTSFDSRLTKERANVESIRMLLSRLGQSRDQHVSHVQQNRRQFPHSRRGKSAIKHAASITPFLSVWGRRALEAFERGVPTLGPKPTVGRNKPFRIRAFWMRPVKQLPLSSNPELPK